jgi:hypothetical protein
MYNAILLIDMATFVIQSNGKDYTYTVDGEYTNEQPEVTGKLKQTVTDENDTQTNTGNGEELTDPNKTGEQTDPNKTGDETVTNETVTNETVTNETVTPGGGRRKSRKPKKGGKRKTSKKAKKGSKKSKK